MRIFSGKWLLILISGIIGGMGLALACAGVGFTWQDESNYTPELVADKSYSPFFFNNSEFEFYYPAFYDEKQHARFNDRIVEDWFSYFDGKYKAEELKTLLLNTRASLVDSLVQGKGQDKLPEISLIRSTDKKTTAFLKYLSTAKQAESFALAKIYTWEDEGAEKPRKPSDEFCKNVRDEFKKCKDKFLKQRWWFQLVRTLYFKGDMFACTVAFESGKKKMSANTMYYRSMCYTAGAYQKSGNIGKGNYYYALAFNAEPELRTTAFSSFKPQDEKDWQQALALCENNDEKTSLWQLMGLKYHDELRALNEIIALDPKSAKAELLLSRAVNETESGLFDVSDPGRIIGEGQKEIVLKSSKLMNIISDALSKGVSNPWKWQMSLAYVQWLNNSYESSAQNFQKAKVSAGSDSLALAQIRMLDMLRQIAEVKKLDAAAENKLLPDLDWFRKIPGNKKYQAVRKEAAGTWMRRAMAEKYRTQGDSLKAEYFRTSNEFYRNPKNLHAMQAIYNKSSHDAYEKYCLQMYEFWPAHLYEFEAIMKTYEDKTDEAIALMDKVEEKGSELPSNPFNGGIKDCHDCDHRKPEKVKFTKLQMLKKMKEMKSKLSTDTYSNAMLLANAYYNITWFGSSRFFFYNRVMDSETNYEDGIPDYYSKIIHDMTLAKKYYGMALAAAVNDEQRARCIYMLSKCERNESEGQEYFAQLKKLPKTKFYQQVIDECGWFKSYISSK
jgi:hypothetical protein